VLQIYVPHPAMHGGLAPATHAMKAKSRLTPQSLAAPTSAGLLRVDQEPAPI